MTRRPLFVRAVLTVAVVALIAGGSPAGCNVPARPTSAATRTPATTGTPAPMGTLAPPGTEPADLDAEAQAFARERGISVAQAHRRLGW